MDVNKITEKDLRKILDEAARASDILSKVETDRFAKCTVEILKAMACLHNDE